MGEGMCACAHSNKTAVFAVPPCTSERLKIVLRPCAPCVADYALVLEAARAGRACLGFRDPIGDATVCHVTHGKNTSKAAPPHVSVYTAANEGQTLTVG